MKYCCNPLREAISRELIQKPGKRLPNGGKFSKYHFMGNQDYMYITNCPFCGQEIIEHS